MRFSSQRLWTFAWFSRRCIELVWKKSTFNLVICFSETNIMVAHWWTYFSIFKINIIFSRFCLKSSSPLSIACVIVWKRKIYNIYNVHNIHIMGRALNIREWGKRICALCTVYNIFCAKIKTRNELMVNHRPT